MVEYTIYADGYLIYSSAFPEMGSVLSPELKLEVNKSGSLSFVILPNHERYDYIKPMTTLVLVYEDDDLLFRGRVIEATPDFYKQKKVVCEGDLSFLLDSIIQPFKYLDDNKATIRSVFKEIVDSHNTQVESWKKFSYDDDYITVTKNSNSTVSDTDIFNYTSYSDAASALDTCLLNEYGGVLRTRTVGSTTYLDYIKDPFQSLNDYPLNEQEIEFSVNLLDLNISYPIDDIFTILLPTGKDNLKIGSVNNGSDYLRNENAIEKFGQIVHHEEWSDVDEPSELMAKAQRYLDEQSRVLPDDLEIKAIDLHLVDPDHVSRLKLCDRVRCYSEPHNIDEILICLSISYDLVNPENCTYKIGSYIPVSNYQGKTSNKTSESKRGGSRSRSSSGKSAQAAKATDDLSVKEETDNRTNIKNALLITGNQVRDLQTHEVRTLNENELLDIDNNLSLPTITDHAGNKITVRDLCTSTSDAVVAANNIALIAGGNMTLAAGQDISLGAEGSLFVHAKNMEAIVGSDKCISTTDGSFSISILKSDDEDTGKTGVAKSLICLNDDIVEINGRQIKIGSEDTDLVSINANTIELTGLIEKLIVKELEAGSIKTITLSSDESNLSQLYAYTISCANFKTITAQIRREGQATDYWDDVATQYWVEQKDYATKSWVDGIGYTRVIEKSITDGSEYSYNLFPMYVYKREFTANDGQTYSVYCAN